MMLLSVFLPFDHPDSLVFSGFVESFLLSDGRHSRRWKYNWWEFLIVFCGTRREILVIFDCYWCPDAMNVLILFCCKSFLTQFTNPLPKDFTQLGKEYPASRIIQINVKLNISTEKEWNSTKFWFLYFYGRFEGQQDTLRLIGWVSRYLVNVIFTKKKKIEEKKKKEKKKVLRAKLSNDEKSIDDVYLPSSPDFCRTY